MLAYEDIWIEPQTPGDHAALLVSMKVQEHLNVGPGFTTAIAGIGAVRFEYLATLKGRSIYQATGLSPVSDQLLAGQGLEQLVWSGLLEGSLSARSAAS
jgi:hypothetical protein